MGKPYYVNLDVSNGLLKKNIIDKLFKTAFLDQLVIVEQNTELTQHISYDLVVMDSQETEENIVSYCQHELLNSPKAIFIHVCNGLPARCDNVHLVGVSNDFFDDYFTHLIGLCFLTHTIRESVDDITSLLTSEVLP